MKFRYNYLRTLTKEETEEYNRKKEQKIKTLVERLAELEHEQWVRWSKDICETGLNKERITRWKTMWKSYSELPEETKELDRKWVYKIIKILEKEGMI